MAGVITIEASKCKMQVLQQHADKAGERAKRLEREVEAEHCARKQAEAEVASLNQHIQLVEEELDQAQEHLAAALQKLEKVKKPEGEREWTVKSIENRALKHEEMMGLPEIKFNETNQINEEANKKYEKVAQKLVIIEGDLEHTVERAELAESHCWELDEQIQFMDQNLKFLAQAKEKYSQKEGKYEEEIKILTEKVKKSETRAEFPERSVATGMLAEGR